jgi:penicillin G amidase
VWGPLVGSTAKGQHLALRWTAHDPDATNFALLDLEAATSAAEALTVAPRAGIPIQNFVVADSAGAIGWTLAGRLPQRFGYDGRLPVTWAFGDRRWDGFVAPEDVPTVFLPAGTATGAANRSAIAPESLASPHHLFTANQRLFGGELLTLLGDGGYHTGMRAGRVKTLLSALPERSKARDLLAIQLDDRAEYLDFWRTALTRVLTDDAIAEKKSRAALRQALEPWAGRAAPDSSSYRLVRSFRRQVCQRVLDPLFQPCRQIYPDFHYGNFHYEAAMRRLVEAQPDNFLTAEYARWDDLLLAAADAVVKEVDEAGLDPDEATWGRANAARIRHPLSRFLPKIFGAFLDLPADELPGDHNVPRVQGPSFGASERFVVSPGRESEGIFHMPGGQSGHPLSPFYRAGHEAWVRGEATPFLPGATAHTLTLTR